ncbi:Uncharacterised protein [Mycobacteroides abscessus subsp. abscessus]|nr:Uncharacterised protein [Mycobacteroides abscessus subsp. abscessus]
MAPPLRMTSRRAWTVWVMPSRTYSTPTARVPSNSTRRAWASVTTFRLRRRRPGLR